MKSAVFLSKTHEKFQKEIQKYFIQNTGFRWLHFCAISLAINEYSQVIMKYSLIEAIHTPNFYFFNISKLLLGQTGTSDYRKSLENTARAVGHSTLKYP